MSVAGYLLLAPQGRREILLDAAFEYKGPDATIAEPGLHISCERHGY